MPGFLLHVNAGVSCFHQAPAVVPPTQPKVLVGGQPVATSDATISVTGCPFQVPAGPTTKPQPCVRIQWGTVATKVLVGGKPALLGPAPGTVPGICQSAEQIPQGSPTISAIQTRVTGM
jgi:hypothetical protein